MFKRWFVTRREFDQALKFHEKRLDRLTDLYWQRYDAHDLLLKTLGLSQVRIPERVELQTNGARRTPMTNRHADIKRQYCEIWMDDNTPWKRVRYKHRDSGDWSKCHSHPIFHDDYDYEFIPEKITIAGITFDAPLREEPVRDADIFIPSMFHPTGYHCDTWSGYSHQQAGLKAGGCFASPEAAAACARAFSKLVGGEV